MMLNIEEPYPHKTAFLQLGFRPFFAAAMGFAAFAIFAWMLLYLNGWSLPSDRYPTMTWHAHEMIFGYAMAVVAGFLLTAIRNWTNRPTINNQALLGLFLLWLSARVLPFFDNDSLLPVTAVLDLAFGLLLFVAAMWPIVKARQWIQAGIISKILLIVFCNFAFYLGLFGVLPDGGRIGLYAGFYLILALILTMIRRLIPFFIEKGVDHPFQAKNNKWLDITSLVLFLLFAISDLIQPYSQSTAFLAFAQFFIHTIRLFNWHHPDIWKKPLLWVIYTAYAWITLGFLLKALSVWTGLSPFLAVHGFAYGGIGMITLGMMTRVALGHTGRSVFTPPKQLTAIFLLLTAGTMFRVVLPIFETTHYLWWITIAQVLWILAFVAALIIYLPMLIKARVDGRPG